MAVEILERWQVSPSRGAATELLLPLLYSDILFLDAPLTETLFFYSFQYSESHFLETVVPNLKNSLSLALKHYLPLAGKILFPLTSGMPVSRYVAGDSVSLTISRSSADFVHLTGNHSRDADEFHYFVSEMPPATYSPDLIELPVAAFQVTLFPNHGFCIGLTIHHAVGDGASVYCFVQAWASINKLNGDAHLVALGEKSLPSYERSNIHDAKRLTTIYWDQMKMRRPTVSLINSLPTNKVRRTFVLSEAEIQKLKMFVLSRKPDIARMSSFVVVCGLLWSCLTKSVGAAECLICAADYRARLSPPLPGTYFGNCLGLALAESTHAKLKGNDGLVAAAQAIGEAINNDRGMDWIKEKRKMFEKGVWQIAGSPKYDVHAVDYGWGRPKKFEPLNIETIRAVYLCKSREGGTDIVLSMPKVKMDAFAAIFNQSLREATQSTFMIKQLMICFLCYPNFFPCLYVLYFAIYVLYVFITPTLKKTMSCMYLLSLFLYKENY